jgi:cobalt-zinc-cadmium efflux system membrane fusion protein
MKNNIIQFVVIISAIITFSCTTSNKIEEPDDSNIQENLVKITSEQFQNSKMKIEKASLQNFTQGIVTNGRIDVPPAYSAQVSAIMGGYVKTSHLLVGDDVKKGQLLLTLENPNFIDIQQDYLETYGKLNFLKSEFARQKTLFDEKITSQKNYLKAESEYKSSLAIFNGLEQKLKLMNLNPSKVKEGKITSIIPVFAPISGSIAEVHVSVGKFMNASEVLITIIDSSHKHLELIVFEKDVLTIKKGQVIEFKIPENSERTYKAEVHLIGKSIDQESRTVSVHGHLENEQEHFLVGMYVEAEIITYNTTKMALPISAFLEENDRYHILVFKEMKDGNYMFEQIPVHIGLKNEEYIEIIDTDQTLKDKEILVKGAFIPLNEEG